MDNYYYNSQKLLDKITINKTSNSEFDNFILTKWNNLHGEEGVFNYKLNVKDEKTIGKFGFLIQLNQERSSKRRAPQQISSLNEDFDDKKFNFTKVSPKEIICDIFYNGNLDGTLLINNSPLTIGHSLLCHRRMEGHPQKLNYPALESAARLLWHSQNSTLKIGYNSPGGLASVNHLHLHLLYLKNELPVQNIKCNYLIKSVNTLNDKYPAKGFCLQITRKLDIGTICQDVILIIDLLIELNIPHNVFLTYGQYLENEKCVRILIYPRKDNYGLKYMTAFNLAFCELSGYVPVGNLDDFNNLTEEAISQFMQEGTQSTFERAKEAVVLLFTKKEELRKKN